MLNRLFEMGLAEVHRHPDVPLLTYSPLAFGHLTGKYFGGANPADARLTRFPSFGPRYAKRNVPDATAAYAELARSVGLSPAKLALAFMRARWFTASTIIGVRSMEQLHENLAATSTNLAPELLAAIEEIPERYPNPAL